MGKNDWMFPDENIDCKKKNPLFEKIMEVGWNESFFGASKYRPPTDILETEHDFLIILEIPGITREAINIEFDNNELIIRGEKKNRHEPCVLKHHNIEREFGTFEQRYRFKSSSVDGDRITASYDDGLLTVRAPKLGTHNDSRACRIEIR